jgi:hypothetical protein
MARVPADRRAGREIQGTPTGDEITIEHEHDARPLQTEDRALIGALPRESRRRAPEGGSLFV